MSLLLLLTGKGPIPETTAPDAGIKKGLFAAILDAVFREDNRIGGQAVTRVVETVNEDEVACIIVESTNGFGENNDGTNDARILLGGEIVEVAGRDRTRFIGLTRGSDETKIPPFHVPGTLVFDLSGNKSAVDHLRRGFSVNTAVGEDLDIIGANLGLQRCVGLDQETWREIIKVVAYLPKQTLDAFRRALTALVGAGNFEVSEDLGSGSPGGLVTSPYQVFVEITGALSSLLRGRFVLNGGERQLTTGALEVVVNNDVNHVLGVFDDTELTRRGFRDGFTNYFTPTGTFSGKTITLDSSPGAAGTAVVVDYGAFTAHYLATDETIMDDGDFYAYLTDPTLAARCVLDLIRAAGVQVDITVTT